MGAIYLVRHGQASFGSDDYDKLSPLGKEQGVVVGEELRRRGLEFAVVRSGSMARQRDTAIAAGFHADQDARWNEYDFADVFAYAPEVPETSDERGYQRVLDASLQAWVAAGPGDGRAAESWDDFTARVDGALESVVSELGSGQNALVFTSGGVIAAITGRILGDRPGLFWRLNRMMANAAITKIISGRSGLTLVALNEHGHFEGARRHLFSFR
ncbi:histidine phosphatase family protein [Thermocrispum municipale]|uniref:histidine phosphatase family protein n=1 Tax=Thermocrispum municipale TaxID=37926 RepID=UPI000413BBFF|nr:histidine phosphatase family protein [Thermocrispum municipale]